MTVCFANTPVGPELVAALKEKASMLLTAEQSLHITFEVYTAYIWCLLFYRSTVYIAKLK